MRKIIALLVILIFVSIGVLSGCTQKVTCSVCNGSGKCSWCGGTGYTIPLIQKCEKCGGTGVCPNCHGTGQVEG
jgi:hypothetical protein